MCGNAGYERAWENGDRADAAADVFYRENHTMSSFSTFDVKRGPTGRRRQPSGNFRTNHDMTQWRRGNSEVEHLKLVILLTREKCPNRSYVREMAEKGAIKRIKEYKY